jgi:hypothetical protein
LGLPKQNAERTGGITIAGGLLAPGIPLALQLLNEGLIAPLFVEGFHAAGQPDTYARSNLCGVETRALNIFALTAGKGVS